jgi:hypothetical protein
MPSLPSFLYARSGISVRKVSARNIAMADYSLVFNLVLGIGGGRAPLQRGKRLTVGGPNPQVAKHEIRRL